MSAIHMANVGIQAAAGAGVGLELAADPTFANVELLANLDGADAYTSYTEESSNAIASASVGANGEGDTAEKKFGTASWKCDSGAPTTLTDTDMTFGQNSNLRPAANDFCLEAHVRLLALPSTFVPQGHLGYFLAGIWNSTFDNRILQLIIDEEDKILFEASTSGTAVTHTAQVTPTTAFVIDQFFHIAASRDDRTLRIFKDGLMLLENTTFFGVAESLRVPSIPAEAFSIGKAASASNLALARSGRCHIDNVRWTIGEPIYTKSFLPPIAAHATS